MELKMFLIQGQTKCTVYVALVLLGYIVHVFVSWKKTSLIISISKLYLNMNDYC